MILTVTAVQADLVVEKIVFRGNHSFNESELKQILKTKEKKEFDNKLLRIDKTMLKNFYLSKGFLRNWVETELDRRGENITVIFEITEGKKFYLGKISLKGVQITSENHLKSLIPAKYGESFQIKKLEQGLNNIEEFYYNNGKPYVEIIEDEVVRDSLINMNVMIKENETVYIHDINYIGLEDVKSFVIRRELELGKGDMYSRRKIEKSQRNIYGTGLFEFVGMELKARDTTRSEVILLVKAVEKKARWIGARFGVGYEQEIVYGGTFDVTIEFGNRNLFGTARSLFLSATPSFSYDFDRSEFINPKNQYSLTYVEPWIGYTRTPGIFRISFIQARPVYSANYDYLNSSFLVSHEFENFWKISGTLAYSQVQFLEGDSLDPEFFALTKGQDFIYSVGSRVTRDKRDNYLNPGNGSLSEFTIKIAYSRSRNSETGETSYNRFIRAIAEWNRYQPFRFMRKWTLATRFKAGNIFELGEIAQIPLSERFYLGGASTVRGYREQLLGPVVFNEEGGNPKALGGKLMLLANAELRIPLFWLLLGEIFIDGGYVWLQPGDFRFQDIRTTSGVGLAVLTPLGPIRFDYGIKHRREENKPPGEFHISIAFAF